MQKKILIGYISLHSQKEIRLPNKLKRLFLYQIAEFACFIFLKMRTNLDIRHSFWNILGLKKLFRVQLKSDALPTLNKSLADASTSKARILTEKKTTRKGNSID